MAALKSNDPLRAEINKHFVIRVLDNHTGNRTLRGAGQYGKLLGDENLKTKHFKKVLEGVEDKYTFKLRRGLTIKFVAK
ncbi:hypothetical protein [uncultured Aquimarina sp.]|uniref:hypothetical protein n=1 Tax=uncultured Aquimarina sp. TaxID=575652 RepID=UPI00262D0F95|nr:hypothetical protein [uncultured Aquimarina sp.]